jgi:hypothetical protein
MKLSIISFLFTVLVSTYDESHSVHAFSTGAGGCTTGGAVGQTHLNSPMTGLLSVGGFQVLLDDTTPLDPTTPTPITVSQMYSLSIVPSAGATFRGALFRVVGTGVNLQPAANAVVATACTDAAGVTHSSPDPKTEFKATLQVDGTVATTVDVTVVVANNGDEGSIYYYSQFSLQPTDAAGAPMATSTEVPVAAPTMDAPAPTVAEPTETPVAAVVPTAEPADMVVPTGTPVAVSEPVPVMEPTVTEAPVAEEPMEPDAPSTGAMNMTDDDNSTTTAPAPSSNMTDDDNNTTAAPVSAPVRAPTMMTPPSPTGPSSLAVISHYPVRSSLLMLFAVVIGAIV